MACRESGGNSWRLEIKYGNLDDSNEGKHRDPDYSSPHYFYQTQLRPWDCIQRINIGGRIFKKR